MAKINVKADGGNAVRTRGPSRALERKFQRFLSGMIATMATRFENNTFKKLNKKTVNKFADASNTVTYNGESFAFNDAQVGNYASVFLSLSKKSRRMILKQFSDERIKKIVTDLLLRVKRNNADVLYSKIENITEISSARLAATEALKPQTNALILETVEWATKLRDDALNQFVADSLRGMAQGMGLDEVVENFNTLSNNRVTRAKMVARTQISTYNSLLTKIRAQNLGITKAVWITSRDERVRASHADRAGKEFDLSDGLYSSVDGKDLLPGVDYNCRCDYRLIVPSEE